MPMIVLFALVALPAAAHGARLSGTVFEDKDADRVRDKGEAGLAQIDVTIRRGGKVVARRETGPKGGWRLKTKRRGRYRVTISAPAGARVTKAPARKRLRKRTKRLRFDAGVVLATAEPEPAPTATPSGPTVGGTVWRDDDDGVREAGEPGEPGVTMEVYDENRTTMIGSIVSDLDGHWSVPVAEGARVRVRMLLPTGGTYAPAAQGTDPAADSDIAPTGANSGYTGVLTAGTVDIGAGVRFPSAVLVGNRMWRDDDGDGIQDAAETATGSFVAGRPVELWNDGLTQRLAQTTTAADGSYQLQAPKGGTYRVRFGLAATYTFTRPLQGTTTTDSDPEWDFTDLYGATNPITPQANTASIDAGVVRQARIGNLVWRDVNGDGDQDTGEEGVAGVTVQLWNAARTEMHDATTTDANGAYQLRTQGPATYRVRVIAPFGLKFTGKDLGGNDLLDSDINTASPLGYTDEIVITSSTTSDTKWDAGLVPS